MKPLLKGGLFGIKRALMNGCEVRAWCDWDRRRLVWVKDRNHQRVASAKHPFTEDALYHAGQDYITSNNGLERCCHCRGEDYPDHQYGSNSSSSKLDNYLLNGRDLRIIYKNGTYVAQLRRLPEGKHWGTDEDMLIKQGESRSLPLAIQRAVEANEVGR